MKTIILKVEDFLATQSVLAPYPFCLYALKMQVKIHMLFPSLFPEAAVNSYELDA